MIARSAVLISIALSLATPLLRAQDPAPPASGIQKGVPSVSRSLTVEVFECASFTPLSAMQISSGNVRTNSVPRHHRYCHALQNSTCLTLCSTPH
jgi:hypothetical protein